jgi:hypothetical protein
MTEQKPSDSDLLKDNESQVKDGENHGYTIKEARTIRR